MLSQMAYQLKITLESVEPLIWRRIVVPSEFTLYDLHRVVQIAMGWEDSHLHDFTIKRKRYALPDPDEFDEAEDESTAQLDGLVRPRTTFTYLYDYGDSWRHAILVEKTLDEVERPLPACLDGARACPPEDSGGPWGYADKLQALAGPESDDEDTQELREWLGADFDPEGFEVDRINRNLQKAFRATKAQANPKKRRK